MEHKTKKDLREKVLTLLRNQKEEERLRKSLAILDKLFRKPEFRKASTILFYASFDGEVETFEMIKRAQQLGKRIALPRVIRQDRRIVPVIVESIEKDLVPGSYGIKQPQHTDTDHVLNVGDIDLVIVPGVMFDRYNARLGRGAGYYDRFLRGLPDGTPTIGLAFDFQVVDHLPHQEEHDIPVSCVVAS